MNGLGKILLRSCAVILAITAIVKLASMGQRIANQPDPLFVIKTKNVLLAVGLIELAVAFYVFRASSLFKSSLLTFCLTSQMWLYRLFVVVSGSPHPCPCLGYLGQWTRLSQSAVEQLATTLLIYLTGVSVFVLGSLIWRRNQLQAQSR